MRRVIALGAMTMASILLAEIVSANDNAIAQAHYSITQQLKQAHDRYRQHKSDYNAGYLKGLEQAQIVLSIYTQSINREDSKAALRQALQQREKQKKQKQRPRQQPTNNKNLKQTQCTSCAYTISPMEFAKKSQQQSQHQTNQRSKTNA